MLDVLLLIYTKLTGVNRISLGINKVFVFGLTTCCMSALVSVISVIETSKIPLLYTNETNKKGFTFVLKQF